MNREGFYSIFFQGQAGYGAGMLVFDTGIVTGADAAGGQYDGSYTYNPATDRLDIQAVVEIPPGVLSVNGMSAGPQPVKFPIKASIPRGHFTGFKHTVQTPYGPIEIVMNKIRDFP